MTSCEWALPPGWAVTADGVLSLPCPPALAESARAFLDGGPQPPAVPRLAATVMLLRPGSSGGPRGDIEVFMLRRSTRMTFAGGALVFPGGRADDRDGEDVSWAGPSPQAWAGRLGCDPDTARAAVVAAVRELFEESGVLLAGRGPGHVVTAVDTAGWAGDQQRLAEHQTSLAEVLGRHGLVLRSDLLGLCGHWVTPEFEPRRYDTYFFSARLPAGQTASCTSSEAVAEHWVTPQAVLAAAARSEIGLLPPTAHSIAQLAECVSAEQFVHENLVAERLMLIPIERRDGGIALSCRLPIPPSAGASGSPSHQKEVTQ